MRSLAASHEDEAMLLHELKARLGAKIIESPRTRRVYAGEAGRFDERRNTSRVFKPKPNAVQEALDALARYRRSLEP